MKCPYCGHLGDKVVDSRESKEGEVIRRRRECLDCGKRFTSYERIDQIPHLVVKKDGNEDGRFDAIAKKTGAPLTFIDDAVDFSEVVKAMYGK